MPTLIASLLRKAALLVLMLLALSLAVFYISRLTPGDPLQSYYGDAVQSMSSAGTVPRWGRPDLGAGA